MERGGLELTWDPPCRKYIDRAIEVANGGAPALPSIIRYNERAASVFSYVSQMFCPPASMEALEQRGVHKMLHMPPNSMSRHLMHSMQPFSTVAPTSVRAW